MTTQNEDRARMPPPPPRLPPRRKEVVLDEDEWVSTLESIIERDFFPDLASLEAKIAWLEAVRTQDPDKIQMAQLSVQRVQTGNRVSESTVARTAQHDSDAAASAPEAGNNVLMPPSVSLDKFLAQYTSEDNASFDELLEKMNEKREQKLLSYTQKKSTASAKDATLRLTDGFGTTGQPLDNLNFPKLEERNAVMFQGRPALPWSAAEVASQGRGPSKSVNYTATRFTGRSGGGMGSGATSALTSGANTPTVGGFSAHSPAHAEASAYNILATPALVPGIEDSPLMTWGNIEATPMRLQDGGFQMKEPSSRELQAHQLAAKSVVSKRPMRGSSTVVLGVNRVTQALTPGRSLRGETMSPAAQRLAGELSKRRRGGGGGGVVDSDLRASYQKTPAMRQTPNRKSEWDDV